MCLCSGITSYEILRVTAPTPVVIDVPVKCLLYVADSYLTKNFCFGLIYGRLTDNSANSITEQLFKDVDISNCLEVLSK